VSTGDHRLSAGQALARAEAFEESRQSSHSPVGGEGTSAGVSLSEATPEDLRSLGMDSPELPEHGPLRQHPMDAGARPYNPGTPHE
jgi:hypothetical protein